MLSVYDDVGKHLKSKLLAITDDAYLNGLSVTQKDVSASPATFPCLYVNSLGEPTSGANFQCEQDYITSTIELQSYSAIGDGGSQTQARDIIDKAGNIMMSMGYELITGPYQSNSDYYRTIARFRRIVGNGESLY